MNHTESLALLDKILTHPSFLKVEDDCYIFGDKSRAKKLISIIIHGNEYVGIHALDNFLLKQTKDFSFGLVIGNRESTKVNKRFVDQDLNRSFDALEQSGNIESRRAQVIEKFSRGFEQIIDIHQTSAKCITPFMIVRQSSPNFEFTHFFKNKFPTLEIVLSAGTSFSSNGKTFSEYSLIKEIPFITFELSQKGYSKEMAELGGNIIYYFLNSSMHLHKSDTQLQCHKIYNKVLKISDEHHLVSGFANLSEIKLGEEISYNKSEKFQSEFNGRILFPKYGEYQKFSNELCQILEPFNWST